MTQSCRFGLQYRIESILYRTSTSTAHSLTAISSILLNFLILLSIWKTPSLRKPSHILIANLALADFLVGAVGQPVIVLKDILIMFKRNVWFDKVCTSGLVGRTLTYWLASVSAVTLTVISIDRFLAIKLKTSYTSVVTMNRIAATLLFWWITNGILFFYFLIFSDLELKSLMIALSVAITIILSIIIISYYKAIKLLKELLAKTSPGRPNAQNSEASSFDVSKYQKSLKTMIIVFITIIVFYIPYFIALVVLAASSNVEYEQNILKYHLVNAAEVLLLANSTFNPVVYLWRMSDLREAAKTTLRTLFRRNRIRTSQN